MSSESQPRGSETIRQMHEAIRQRILSGAYEAGRHITAADLAGEFGVSRTPAREALLMLAQEGFVEVFPNRGAYVRSWSEEDIEEVFQLRILLEPHAAWRAAQVATDEDIEVLDRLAREMEVAAKGDRDKLPGLNDQFHRRITAISGGARLERFIDATYELVLQAQTYGRFDEQDMARSMMHHRDLVSAFRHRDAELARSTMKNHILNARLRYMRRS